MAFSENLKLEVKRKAAFRCCRCQEIGVEIHHIIPQSGKGPDTIENAAPLCAKCHADFGDNPKKRKEIREMRDWWYETSALKYSSIDPKFYAIEQKIDQLLNALTTSQSNPLNDLKHSLKNYIDVLFQNANQNNIQSIVSAIVNIEKPPFIAGSPCQMSGQPCPSLVCTDGIIDIDSSQTGVSCNKCGLFIPA